MLVLNYKSSELLNVFLSIEYQFTQHFNPLRKLCSFLTKLMKLLKHFLLIFKVSLLLFKELLFIVVFCIHSLFHSMILSYCIDKSLNGFLTRTLQVIDDFLCDLDLGFAKVKFCLEILCILNQLCSIFSKHLCPFILLIHSKLLKSKLFV